MIFHSDVQDAISKSVCHLVADMETGEILYAARQTEIMFGYAVQGEMVGKCVDELLPIALRAQHASHRTEYAVDPQMRTMGGRMNLMGQHHDGHMFPVAISLLPAVIAKHRVVVALIFDVPIIKETT